MGPSVLESESNLKNRKLGLAARAYNHNAQEAEAGELFQVPGPSGLQRETMLPTPKSGGRVEKISRTSELQYGPSLSVVLNSLSLPGPVGTPGMGHHTFFITSSGIYLVGHTCSPSLVSM